MPGVSKEQIASAKKMTAIEFLRRYRSTDLVKSSARGEFELRSHDSFKINGESSIWHWKSRGIGGKSALDYLVHVEQCGFVEAVRMLCDEVPGYIPVPMKRWSRSVLHSRCRLQPPTMPGWLRTFAGEVSPRWYSVTVWTVASYMKAFRTTTVCL